MFIFSNLATSLDGKIATASRELYALGTAQDRKTMQALRGKCDVVLFGASSLRAFQRPCILSGPLVRGLKKQPANAVLSSHLKRISPTWPFFTRGDFHRMIFVSEKTPSVNLRPFEASCEIISLPRATDRCSTAKQVIHSLAQRGYAKVLIEGGGTVMWDFVRENLIDEYHVTLTPKLIGGTDAPTLVDGSGFDPKQVLNLKLKTCRKIGNELYLTYRKTERRG